MRVLEVMHDKTTSTMQQGIGTNHKRLQVHESNPKSLQKQYGTNLKSYISMGTNINTSLFNEHTSLLVMHLKHRYM